MKAVGVVRSAESKRGGCDAFSGVDKGRGGERAHGGGGHGVLPAKAEHVGQVLAQLISSLVRLRVLGGAPIGCCISRFVRLVNVGDNVNGTGWRRVGCLLVRACLLLLSHAVVEGRIPSQKDSCHLRLFLGKHGISSDLYGH